MVFSEQRWHDSFGLSRKRQQASPSVATRITGNELGILWHKPFQVEVGKALRAGSNTLEAEVSNLWINRLIGDEKQAADSRYHETDMDWFTDRSLLEWPDWLTEAKPRPVPERVAFTTWKHYNAADQLQLSGLIGPVTLRLSRFVEVN